MDILAPGGLFENARGNFCDLEKCGKRSPSKAAAACLPSIQPMAPGDAPIWRYFDLPKWLSLLEHRALYFSRADLLGDRFEGSATKQRLFSRQRLLESPPDGRTREDLEAVFEHNSRIFKSHRERVYVNCWHIGTHESMAMWLGYGGGAYGIAIQSTVDRLESTLPRSFGPFEINDILMAPVRYVDYADENLQVPDANNVFGPFFCKAKAFWHEQELRALLFSPSTVSSVPGYFVPLNLTELISSVVVSPYAPGWFSDLIESSARRYGFDGSVRRSDMSGEPIF
jgi:hypothetical protein